MTKLLVGVGIARDGLTNTIEDLESTLTTCKNLTNLPLELWGSFGGLGFQDKPLICGGEDSKTRFSRECFSWEGNGWIYSSSLNTDRYHAAVLPSPYQTENQKLLVTGGINDFKNRDVEVLTRQGWKTLPQRLPVEIYFHCSVLVNSTTIMVIGGWQNGSFPSLLDNASSDTFLFNTENEIWTVGPQLKKGRAAHSCGRIRKNSQSQDFSILVAGGLVEGSDGSSVEILDLGTNEWRKGPDLPFGIMLAQMVEDPNGGVVLVGGSSQYPNSFLDTLYQLPHGGADAVWTKMKQKLKIGRKRHVAFLVPDDVVDCS
jgi:hypothetical protein